MGRSSPLRAMRLAAAGGPGEGHPAGPERPCAAARPQIAQQGFSLGGRYHLLLTSLIRDGSGFPSAALQITDVRRNRLVARREQVWQEVDPGALPGLVAAWRGAQAPLLGRYGLTHPVLGKRLFQLQPLPAAEYPGDGPSSAATRVRPAAAAGRP